MSFYKILLLSFSGFICLSGCSKKQDNNQLNQGSKTFSYYSNSQIDTLAGYTIKSGNFTVFEYNYVHPDDPAIADDEVSDKIIFQIPASQTSFTIADSQITNAIFRRWRYCFCFFIGPYMNYGGTITGVKNGNSWMITGNIKTSGSETIDVSGTYTIK